MQSCESSNILIVCRFDVCDIECRSGLHVDIYQLVAVAATFRDAVVVTLKHIGQH
jgi:hypothetical protein